MGWAERGADSCRVEGGHEVWGGEGERPGKPSPREEKRGVTTLPLPCCPCSGHLVHPPASGGLPLWCIRRGLGPIDKYLLGLLRLSTDCQEVLLNLTPTPPVLSPFPGSGPLGNLGLYSSTSSCLNRWPLGSHPSCPTDSWHLPPSSFPYGGENPQPGAQSVVPSDECLFPAPLSSPLAFILRGSWAPSVDMVCHQSSAVPSLPPSLPSSICLLIHSSLRNLQWVSHPQNSLT